MKSRSSATKRNAVFRPAEVGEFFFKGLDFRTLNECRRLADAVESGENFTPQLRIFRLEIEKRHFHVFGTHGTNKNCTVRQPRPQVPQPSRVCPNKFLTQRSRVIVLGPWQARLCPTEENPIIGNTPGQPRGKNYVSQ